MLFNGPFNISGGTQEWFGLVSQYDAASLLIFAAFSTPPDTTRKGAIDTCVRALKSAGVWTKLDVLYLFAAADSQAALINWKAPGTFNATATSSPTFTADRGYTGNGSSSYVDSNYNLSSSGGVYAASDAALFAWNLRVGIPSAPNGLMGSSGTDVTQIYPRLGGGNTLRVCINTTSAIIDIGGNTASEGFYAASRTASNAAAVYKNGSSVGTNSTSTSPALPNTTMTFLRVNAQHADWQCAGGGFGSSLNSTEHAALCNALSAYLTSVGALGGRMMGFPFPVTN